MYLGQYREVLEQFAGRASVTREQMIGWLRDHAKGRRFWVALCVQCGFAPEPFDSSKYEIEHINNASWGGVDHPLNYMVLYASVNRSVEFREGPSHLKMILLGRRLYGQVKRFAVWNSKVSKTKPKDTFVMEDGSVATVMLLSDLRQTVLACGKRARGQ